MGQDNPILKNKKVQDPYLIMSDLDSKLMNTICQNISIWVRQERSHFLQLINPGDNLVAMGLFLL